MNIEKKFLIDISTFWADVGGVVALHKLCDDIRSLGREAYVTSRNTHPKLNAPFIGGRSINTEEWVVIYPEITIGNPLRFKHVVRWILYTPKSSDFYSSKRDTDLVFKYSNLFEYVGIENGMLSTWFIDYDCFYNHGNPRDIDSCFLIKKKGASDTIHPADSIDVSNFAKDWNAMAAIFNKCKYFYCYDNETFWVTLAALCGCIPIIIPNNPLLSSEQWKLNFPWTKYGIAYGPEELSYATSSLHMVKPLCKELEKANLTTVTNMINMCDLL